MVGPPAEHREAGVCGCTGFTWQRLGSRKRPLATYVLLVLSGCLCTLLFHPGPRLWDGTTHIRERSSPLVDPMRRSPRHTRRRASLNQQALLPPVKLVIKISQMTEGKYLRVLRALLR